MDNILLITVLTIFLAAFIGSVIKYRMHDKCLRDFKGYFINVEFLDGRRIWGKLRVFHNAMEMKYPTPMATSSGQHMETSALIYQNQFGTIRGLKRYHDELSPENQARRRTEINRTYNPGVLRRGWRGTRNIFNLLRDAFSQAVSVFIGAFKRGGAGMLLNTQDARITSTAQQVITSASSAYEPVLERYIGRNVVLEITHDGKKRDNFGILKEYSDHFITVLDVPVLEDHAFNLAAEAQLQVNRDFDFSVEPVWGEEAGEVSLRVVFTNKSRKQVELVRAEGEGYLQSIDRPVSEGATVTIDLQHIPVPPVLEADDGVASAVRTIPPVQLWVRCRRYMDLVAPRSVAVIRHGAQPVTPKKVA